MEENGARRRVHSRVVKDLSVYKKKKKICKGVYQQGDWETRKAGCTKRVETTTNAGAEKDEGVRRVRLAGGENDGGDDDGGGDADDGGIADGDRWATTAAKGATTTARTKTGAATPTGAASPTGAVSNVLAATPTRAASTTGGDDADRRSGGRER